ncbi:MAG: helix-turn-helix transcriptional regulator [Pseudomonadota bacterium]
MQLKEFLKKNGLQMSEFGAMVGTTGATICRIANGQVPRKALMAKIHEATGGQVSPNDLVGVSDTQRDDHRGEDNLDGDVTQSRTPSIPTRDAGGNAK